MSPKSGRPADDPAGSVREPTYLERIVPAVLRRLEERKQRTTQAEIEATPRSAAPPSFAAALQAPGVSLIAEIKRASPSKGPIRPALEPGALARIYERAGARAISVLTEQDHFHGSLEDLASVRAATDLPVLCKDFILDPYQLHEARAYGASAVLLVAALLSDKELRALAGLAADLGLDVLLEVHDRREMARALHIQTAIIGVNNRDLRTFAVSLDTTVAMAGLIPPGRLLVGESGIWTRADVQRLAAAGVDGVLVGESLLRSSDVEAAIAELMGSALAARADAGTRLWTEEV